MSSSSDEVNLLGKRNPEDDDLETKPILKKHKEQSEEDKDSKKGFDESLQERVELLETESDQSNLISVNEIVEGLDRTPQFVEGTATLKKTLFVTNLSPQTEISNIISFFKDVGQVVRVRLSVDDMGEHVGSGFVEFASANEANKALEKKNGELLQDREIVLTVVKKGATYRLPIYCIDHKVWSKDYLRHELLPTEEDKKPRNSFEVVLLVANLSPQTKIPHIYNFFKYAGIVVSLRLIVNDEGQHVGYGFVQFAYPSGAKNALENMNGQYLHAHKIFLDVAKKTPHPPRPKYNLAEKLCYEDYVRRESLLPSEDETVEGLNGNPHIVEAIAVRKRTLYIANLQNTTKTSDIVDFFKDVGVVISVRLILNFKGKRMGCGFVEFASSNEAEKALQTKNREKLCDHKVFLKVARMAPYPPPKYCTDHRVWYEDYLREEDLLIEGDEAVDETPDFVREVAARKKTLFVASLSPKHNISDLFGFFQDVGGVVNIRLIVNHEGKHVGCGFVEFASAKQAKMALETKNSEYFRRFSVDVVKTAPYPLRPKYNLAEKLWYEDYLERESLVKEEDDLGTRESLAIEEDDLETRESLVIEEDDWETIAKLRRMEDFGVTRRMDVFCGKKITFSDDD